jgi:hypothetical protein
MPINKKQKTVKVNVSKTTTITVSQMKEVLACLPDEAPLWVGKTLKSTDGVSFDIKRKVFYING